VHQPARAIVFSVEIPLALYIGAFLCVLFPEQTTDAELMALSVSAAARVLMINSQVLLLAILEERARMELRYKVFGRSRSSEMQNARRNSDCCYLLCMRRRRELYSSVFALCLLPEMQKSFDCRLELSFVDAQ
jgi:hypothetical protein